MNRLQYDYSNTFWEDSRFNMDVGIPKNTKVIGDKLIFNYLNEKETKEFMKIKCLEDPEIMKDIRYKKLKRILKIK